jgi:hypothetical protein
VDVGEILIVDEVLPRSASAGTGSRTRLSLMRELRRVTLAP